MCRQCRTNNSGLVVTRPEEVAEGLSADSQFVSWYLKNDARERSGYLIKFAIDGSIPKALSDSSSSESKVPEKARNAAQQGLAKVSATIPKDQSFDAIFLMTNDYPSRSGVVGARRKWRTRWRFSPPTPRPTSPERPWW